MNLRRRSSAYNGGTSRGHLELPASGRGGKAFPGTLRGETCRLLDFRACCLSKSEVFAAQPQLVPHTVTWA